MNGVRLLILKGSTRIFWVMLIIGLAVGIPTFIATLTTSSPRIRIGISTFIGLWFGLVLFAFYRAKKSFKKVEQLEKLISISEEEVRLSIPLKAEIGYFNATGYWSSSGKSRSYNVRRKFIKESEATVSSLELENKPFFLAIAQDGEGEVYLPGIRITEEEYKGTLVLYAKPSYKFKFPVESFSVSHEGDFAEARIEEKQNGFRVFVNANLSKARRVKVELISRGNRVVKELIGDTKSIGVFEKEFLSEPLVVAGHYGQLSPLEILKAGKFGRIISGHGRFILRLALDVPFRPDIKEEIEFEVLPEKEGVTSWGL